MCQAQKTFVMGRFIHILICLDNTWSVDVETIEMERLAEMIVESKRENLVRRNTELKLIN